jgi:hypothetical protein
MQKSIQNAGTNLQVASTAEGGQIENGFGDSGRTGMRRIASEVCLAGGNQDVVAPVLGHHRRVADDEVLRR